MLRLDHQNVVRGIELPDEVKCQLTVGDMPVLAMEYCQLGDLRQVRASVCLFNNTTCDTVNTVTCS